MSRVLYHVNHVNIRTVTPTMLAFSFPSVGNAHLHRCQDRVGGFLFFFFFFWTNPMNSKRSDILRS